MAKWIFAGTLLCCCLIHSFTATAQPGPDTGSFKQEQLRNAIGRYNQFTGANLPVYNGSGYIPFIFKKEGNPFFESDSLSVGSVGYAGRYYPGIPMYFDIARNELVIANYTHQALVVPDENKIDSFHLLHHRFIRLHHYDSIASPPVTGFYDLLYDGDLKVWVRRTKNYQPNTSGTTLVWIFYQRNYYYIYKNNTYYPVSSKRDILAVLPDKRHEIKKYARRHGIKFNKATFDSAITGVASYYDQLTH